MEPELPCLVKSHTSNLCNVKTGQNHLGEDLGQPCFSENGLHQPESSYDEYQAKN